MNVTTVTIEWPGQALESVIALHRADSRQLGFFPRGAFEDHARMGQILVARNERDEVLGYLLYRVAKQRAMIVHLCTAPGARGKGVARALVQHLKGATASLAGIGLRCRQDYDARHVWAKFGFSALHRKAGRSQDGHELTFWWFDHGHPDLFSLAPNNDDRRQPVVVDANIFFDLEDCANRDNEDSKALLADWIQASIELCVTKEIHNEIDCGGDPGLRARSKAAVTRYTLLKSDDTRFQQICEELKPMFPEAAVLRDEADLRQVAYAVAGDAAYLVTRDQRLAERCDPLYERYGLRVLHPAELISSLDVIEREAEYRPAWIEGSRLQSRAVQGEDLDTVVDAFRDKTNEKPSDFRKAVLHCLSKPREIEARLVTDRERLPVILGVVSRAREDVLDVTMLRASDHGLAATLVRNFLRTTLETAAKENRRLIFVSDSGAGVTVRDALAEFGFTASNDSWVKIAIRSVGGFAALRGAVESAARQVGCESLAESARLAVNTAERSKDAESVAAVESRFWPAKITGTDLPTFIVSIRAELGSAFFRRRSRVPVSFRHPRRTFARDRRCLLLLGPA